MELIIEHHRQDNSDDRKSKWKSEFSYYAELVASKRYKKLKTILASRIDEDKELNKSVYSWLGFVCYSMRNYIEAEKYLISAIPLSRSNHQASTYLACCLLQLGQYEKACIKFDLVRLRAPARSIDEYEWQWANACEDTYLFSEAIIAYQFIEKRGQYSRINVISRLALILAASPDELCRNGPEALAYAKEACEITEWSDWVSTSLLAAAYANEGDFIEAVKYAQLTKDLAPAEESESREERIEMYQSNIPFRLEGELRSEVDPI